MRPVTPRTVFTCLVYNTFVRLALDALPATIQFNLLCIYLIIFRPEKYSAHALLITLISPS